MVSRALGAAGRAVLVPCLCGALATIAACSASRTEVIVVTDTDLRGPGGIDNMIATVTGPSGDIQMSSARIGAGEPPLPRTLGLVWEGGRLGPFTVRLTGNAGGATLVTRVASFSFQEGRTLALRMDLLASCASATCGGEQTCGESGCRPIAIDPGELQQWSGRPPALDVDAATAPIDGGSPPPVDGCAPSSETCNGADDDCDGSIDETFDLDADEANCGACGRACDFANATGECSAGECAIAACDAGWADCNDSGADGCEIDLQNDRTSCGTCGTSCSSVRDCCDGACSRDCP
jgi:hypothetical protein